MLLINQSIFIEGNTERHNKMLKQKTAQKQKRTRN